MKPVTVLHVIGGGEFGGAEQHILNLAAGLKFTEINLKLCCLYAEPFYTIARQAGVAAWRLPMQGKFDVGIIKRLAKLIADQQVDVVHTHGVRANLVGRLAARLAHRPVITTVHSCLRNDYPQPLTRWVYTVIERGTATLTHRFIAVSESLRDQLAGQGVPLPKISVVYNGIDFTHYDLLQLVRDEAAVPTVGVIGRLHPVKGQQHFIQAATAVLADRPDTTFVVAGTGNQQARLEELATKLEIEDKVRFLGFVDDVPALLTSLDLVVIPSLAEGFGLIAAEALALEVPVVATRVGGLPEVVQDHATGLLVNPADEADLARGIVWMLNHPHEAKEMAQKGSHYVRQHFSSQGMAKHTKRLYMEVAGQHD